MGTIASSPQTEQEAIALMRRVTWYLGGKKVRVVGPANWFKEGNLEFRVSGATLHRNKLGNYYVRVYGSEIGPIGIKQFNELELT